MSLFLKCKLVNNKFISHLQSLFLPARFSSNNSSCPVQVGRETVQLLERLSLVNFNNEAGIKRLESAIQFANQLLEVDTKDVEPLYSVQENRSLYLRDDTIVVPDCSEELLRCASKTEDIYFATCRLPKARSSLAQYGMRRKLVILGCGWGSYSVLRNISKKLYDVVVVSPRNHFLFTPLLASTTVGTLEFRSIIESIRNAGFRHTDHFHLAHATGLDADAHRLSCQSVLDPSNRYEVSYDILAIGVGALSNTFGVRGVEEHACFLKEISDARKIRDKILSNFELAVRPGAGNAERKRRLHTVIVGGGPTGVEFGAELHDFIQQDVTRLYKTEAELVQVTLIESNKILGAFDTRLQAYAEKKMKTRDKFNLIKATVTAITEDTITLNNGQEIPYGLVVWSTGLAPRTFTKNLNFPKSPSGQLLTDGHLRVLGVPAGNVYALGDCAEISGVPLPCTAQVAERQGLYLSKLLNSNGSSSSFPAFEFKSLGMLAYIGNYEALSDLPEVKLRGHTSWFLWRSAYLTRLGSWRLRMQVPLDWMKTLLFGRDTSRF